MTAGIITLTHNDIGLEIYNTACMIFDKELAKYKHIGLRRSFDLDKLEKSIEELIQQWNTDDGILILTDIVGASPCNLSCRFKDRKSINVISGLNLAMMLKAMNKINLPINKLTKEVKAAGTQSINEY